MDKYFCKCYEAKTKNYKIKTYLMLIKLFWLGSKQSKELYKEILKSLSGVNQKDRARKRKKLEKELASANQRIENLQDLLVDGTISPKVYRQTLNRYTKQRDQITSSLNGLNTSDSEYKGLIKNAFQHLENFKQTYTNSAISHKKKLIGSIFPEKIEFDGKNVELQESMMC